jgi:hypothetical protein
MKHALSAGLLALTLSAQLPCGAAEGGIVGTWKLVSYASEDPDTKEITYPLGAHPKGYLTYTAGGRMFAVVAKEQRALLAGGNRINAPAEDRAQAFSTSTGYTGTYTFTGDRVVHHVDVAVNPNWVGTDQVRYLKLDGNTLTLKTPPLPTLPDGKSRVSTVVWERVE